MPSPPSTVVPATDVAGLAWENDWNVNLSLPAKPSNFRVSATFTGLGAKPVNVAVALATLKVSALAVPGTLTKGSKNP